MNKKMKFKKIIAYYLLCFYTMSVFASTSDDKIINQFIEGFINSEMMRFDGNQNNTNIFSENAITLIKKTFNKTALDEEEKNMIPQIVEISKNTHDEILHDPIYFTRVKNIFKKHLSDSEIIALWTAPSPPNQEVYIKYGNASLEASKLSLEFTKEKLNDPQFSHDFQLKIQQILNNKNTITP